MHLQQRAIPKGFVVKPRSRQEIKNLTAAIRVASPEAIQLTGALDVVYLLEHLNEGTGFEILEDSYLPEQTYAITDNRGCIRIKQSIYEAACDGDPRHRFTIAHEIGHKLMHASEIGFARSSDASTKSFCDSEWQANEFAGQLLLPDDVLKAHWQDDPYIASELLGVSMECVEVRKKIYRQEFGSSYYW